MLTRRRFTNHASAALLLPALPTGASLLASHRGSAAYLAPLQDLFPNSLDSARAIGIRCLATVEDCTPERLLGALCSDRRDRPLLASGSTVETRSLMDAKIRADFAAGRTTRVDSWVLSDTEVRLFAFLARD